MIMSRSFWKIVIITKKHLALANRDRKCPFIYLDLFCVIFSRGFAHSSVDALHPLPERPEESLPLSYIETVRNGNFTNFTPDTSGRSSPTTDNTLSIANGLSESNTWSTNTGILTGRSSVYSWGNEDVS